MSSIVGKMLGAVSSWKSGPLSIYRLLLPGFQSIFGDTAGTFASEVKLSLVAPPGYFPGVVRDAYESMRFLYGRKIPLRVKVITREGSMSLRYGLAQSGHSLQMRGEKRYADELLARVRGELETDQLGTGLNTPRVGTQVPEGWVEADSVGNLAQAQNQSGGSGIFLKSFGVLGALIGIVAALAFFSGNRKPEQDSLGTAVAHLRKRGVEQLQLLRSERVEGGEKFYFQGATESYTVVVDRDERVYSWSRFPSDNGVEALR